MPRTTTKGGWLASSTDRDGYATIGLFKKSKQRFKYVHALILETYVGPRPDGMVCRHLDGNPANNELSNLCWGTQSENIQDAVRQGTFSGLHRRGNKHSQAKLNEDQAREIYNYYHNEGIPIKELADGYNVPKSIIKNVIYKRAWKHLWE